MGMAGADAMFAGGPGRGREVGGVAIARGALGVSAVMSVVSVSSAVAPDDDCCGAVPF